MSIRRLVMVLYFGLLIGLSGSFVGMAKPTAAAASATTCATNTTTAIIATNGLVAFTLAKSSGHITSLQLRGQELLGNGGVIYWDMNDSAFGTFDLGSSDAANTTYAVACPANESFIDVSITHHASNVEPMSIAQHYILQAGTPAIHLFTVISHSSSLVSDTLSQFRSVMRGDPTIFTHASVEDDPIGPAWRQGASTFPTPQQIAQAPQAQDATYDLQGLKSAYSKRYYTKYDWSVYYRNHALHGFYGNGYGAWMTMEHNESFNGGPTHQDLTVHQTTTTPVVLNMEQSTHFGGPPIVATDNWSKTYGPYLLYLNTGTDSTTLRNDALTYTNPTWDQAFYDTLGIPRYATSSQRSTVTGKVTLSDGNTMSGSTVVLSDNKTDFTRTWQGYQYWASVNADGTFRLSGVRPGTYRLSVYRPRYFGDFQIDNVTIPAGTTYILPPQVWTPPTFGSQIWQIGEPDRTSTEFMNGANFRNYGNYLLFPQQFPNSVNYVIGQHHAATNWNYTQYQVNNGVRLPDWKVQFNLAHTPTKGSIATLTIALAGWSLDIPGLPVGTPPLPGSLTVIVNGVKLPAWVLPADAPDSASYRSGASGDYHLDYIQFSASSLLTTGTNTLALRLNDGSTMAFNNAQYDALRFEIH